MNFPLGERLSFLVDMLPQGELWDIGCDHGLLGLQAYAVGKCSKVYLVDASTSAIQSLNAKLRSPRHAGWLQQNESNIQITCQRGEDIAATVTGVAVIAGMGGETMVGILKNIRAKQLLLNPFSHLEEVVEFLEEDNWECERFLVREREVGYHVIRAKKKEP